MTGPLAVKFVAVEVISVGGKSFVPQLVKVYLALTWMKVKLATSSLVMCLAEFHLGEIGLPVVPVVVVEVNLENEKSLKVRSATVRHAQFWNKPALAAQIFVMLTVR